MKTVNIEVSKSQSGGYSLLIGDENTGYRLAGDKVGGCNSVCDFNVDVKELLEQVEIYGKLGPTRAELQSALTELVLFTKPSKTNAVALKYAHNVLAKLGGVK